MSVSQLNYLRFLHTLQTPLFLQLRIASPQRAAVAPISSGDTVNLVTARVFPPKVQAQEGGENDSKNL
jgi:hypothetical protein